MNDSILQNSTGTDIADFFSHWKKELAMIIKLNLKHTLHYLPQMRYSGKFEFFGHHFVRSQ